MRNAVSLIILFVTCATVSAVDPPKPDSAKELAAMLTANSEETVDELIAQRKKQIEALMKIADPDAKPLAENKARAAAAYLLGKIRAEEAVYVLARGLEHPTELIDGPVTPHRFDYSYFEALVAIGRPSVPAMVKLIGESDSKRARVSANRVIGHILGPKGRVEELEKALSRTGLEPQQTRIADALKLAKEKLNEGK